MIDRAHDVGTEIRNRRRTLGLTQADIAEATGLSQQAISSIEKGRSLPGLDTAVRIARALGVTVEDLLPVEAAV